MLLEDKKAIREIQSEIQKENLEYTLFSWSKQKGISPKVIDRAKGVYLYTHDGTPILDFSSGLMNVNIGHGDPRVTEAVVRQMEKVSYVTPACATEVRGLLGKKLAEITPGNLNKAFFTVCGATSIENAIKLARLHTGRHKILTRYRSYHGATLGAMSAGGDPRRMKVDAHQAANFVHLEIPYAYRSHGPDWIRESFDHLERLIAYEGPQTIAAILMEGESGTSGCLKLPPGYWKKLREVCDRHGILLISDEVMSGFGRTGSWFGVENHGVVPDMIAMAKGITSGYIPFGALMVSDDIASRFDEEPMMLGLTYSAHPVACAAALEVINIYESDHLTENARAMGTYMEARMEELKAIHPSIGDFRNTGLLGCLELVKNRDTKQAMAPFNASPSESEVMNQVRARIAELGMYTFSKWSYIFIAPPLCITKSQIDEGLDHLSEALKIADAACENQS